MRQLVCDNCGGHKFVKKNGVKVCAFCGTSYVMQIDDVLIKESQISLNDDVQRLLEKCKKDPLNAKRYANLVLDIDPSNSEAYKYL